MKTGFFFTDAREHSRTRPRLRLGRTRLIATAVLVSLAATGLAGPATQAGDATTTAQAVTVVAAGPDRTSAAQARLVDRVPTPVLHWTACRKTAQCATAELPLDYSDPGGARIRVALLRIRAKDPRHRLGTLFVNPGDPAVQPGPGPSA